MLPSEVPDIWKKIVEGASTPLCVFDRDFRLIGFNQAHNDEFFRVNGYYTKIGDIFPELFVPEQTPVMRALMARALSGEKFTTVEEFGNPTLGTPHWEITYAPLRDDNGEIFAAFHVAIDISAKLRAEAALSMTEDARELLERSVLQRTKELNDSQARLHSIFADSSIMQVVATKSGIVLDANVLALKTIGLPLKSVIGTSLLEMPGVLISPETQEFAKNAFPLIAQGGSVRREINFDMAEGGSRWFDICLRPIRNDAGETVAIAAEGTETTERRLAEEALLQAQKMEAVGQLTGGLAHDFNNLLAIISGNLQTLKRRVNSGRIEDLDRYVESADAAARRAAALTQRLLAFSRRQTLDPRPIIVNALIAGMEDLIKRSTGPSIKVKIDPATDLWTTRIDAPQLENALLNLCINARDAMAPDGGDIRISTKNVHVSPGSIIAKNLPSGDYVQMTVCDTGPGMSEEVRARAFDPFFTTKPLGQGTGLGLSMVYGFAKQSGGGASIRSKPNGGAEVCLYLPRFLGDSSVETARQVAEVRDFASGSALVIDDEPETRLLVKQVLEECGCAAIETSDGQTALSLIENDASISLIVTDAGLPGGLSSRQVADAARVFRPNLKIIFITGHAAIGDSDLGPGMAALSKPFELSALREKINLLLGGT